MNADFWLCNDAAFSLCLKADEMVKLGSKLKESILFESELLAMILALTVWQPYVGHCPVLIFIDDNAVRDVVISGRRVVEWHPKWCGRCCGLKMLRQSGHGTRECRRSRIQLICHQSNLAVV